MGTDRWHPRYVITVRAMDLEQQLFLATVASWAAIILSTVVGLLLLYVVIRQGVFHGLRAHTRWVDGGKR